MSLPFRNGVLETVGKEDFLPFEKEILVNGGGAKGTSITIMIRFIWKFRCHIDSQKGLLHSFVASQSKLRPTTVHCIFVCLT